MILLVVGAGELADGLEVALQHGDAPRPTARNKPGNADSSAERRA